DQEPGLCFRRGIGIVLIPFRSVLNHVQGLRMQTVQDPDSVPALGDAIAQGGGIELGDIVGNAAFEFWMLFPSVEGGSSNPELVRDLRVAEIVFCEKHGGPISLGIPAKLFSFVRLAWPLLCHHVPRNDKRRPREGTQRAQSGRHSPACYVLPVV